MPAGLSVTRTLNLARFNLTLLLRNRLTGIYAVLFPVLPLIILFVGERGDPRLGATAIDLVFAFAALFPVYYNTLSQFVSRRDELVLKRMRTGPARDDELLASLALPGIACALVAILVSVPVAAVAGQPLPVNPIVWIVGVALALVMLAAFAIWTAAWTANSEAAQLTSLPVILLIVAGPALLPLADGSNTLLAVLERTPGVAMTEITQIAWFGFAGAGAEAPTLNFATVFQHARDPLVTLSVWIMIAAALAKRSLRWEPRV